MDYAIYIIAGVLLFLLVCYRLSFKRLVIEISRLVWLIDVSGHRSLLSSLTAKAGFPLLQTLVIEALTKLDADSKLRESVRSTATVCSVYRGREE